MTKFRYPTAEELQALELAARRARAAEVARLFAAGASAVKSIVVGAAVSRSARGMRHA